MEQEQRSQSPLENIGLYGCLDLMRRNMPMFVFDYSVKNLHIFLIGWALGKNDTNNPSTEEETEFFKGFSEFVFKKYRVGGSLGWSGHIIQKCGGDGREAVDEFYRLFDEFRERK